MYFCKLEIKKTLTMKKSLFLIPVLALVLIFSLTQCKKNYNCGLKVICHFTTTGIDTGNVVSNATLTIYPNAITAGRTVHPAIEQGKDAVTNDNGVYEHTYPYEALLNVTATYRDTVENKEYVGNTQIKLQEGQVIEKVILMSPRQ